MLLTDRAVLSYISNHPECGRSQIRRHVAPDASTSTVWRALRRLVDAGKLQMVGEGRATRYRVAGSEAVLTHTSRHGDSLPVGLSHATARTLHDRYRPNETRYLTDADREPSWKRREPPSSRRSTAIPRRSPTPAASSKSSRSTCPGRRHGWRATATTSSRPIDWCDPPGGLPRASRKAGRNHDPQSQERDPVRRREHHRDSRSCCATDHAQPPRPPREATDLRSPPWWEALRRMHRSRSARSATTSPWGTASRCGTSSTLSSGQGRPDRPTRTSSRSSCWCTFRTCNRSRT